MQFRSEQGRLNSRSPRTASPRTASPRTATPRTATPRTATLRTQLLGCRRLAYRSRCNPMPLKGQSELFDEF
jgi:hypothetical protein